VNEEARPLEQLFKKTIMSNIIRHSASPWSYHARNTKQSQINEAESRWHAISNRQNNKEKDIHMYLEVASEYFKVQRANFWTAKLCSTIVYYAYQQRQHFWNYRSSGNIELVNVKRKM